MTQHGTKKLGRVKAYHILKSFGGINIHPIPAMCGFTKIPGGWPAAPWDPKKIQNEMIEWIQHKTRGSWEIYLGLVGCNRISGMYLGLVGLTRLSSFFSSLSLARLFWIDHYLVHIWSNPHSLRNLELVGKWSGNHFSPHFFHPIGSLTTYKNHGFLLRSW